MIGRELKHYAIEEVLGQGGMGTVYRARDTRLQRPVAVKVLKADVTVDPGRRARFFQEARAAAAITHPSIAQVYDVDEVDGTTFIAMELVEGKTVRQLIADKDLDLMAGIDIAIQVGEGLARAHETGVVHRDIKSENIIVDREGHAKVLDFGLAKLDPLRNQEAAPGGTGEERLSQLATMAQTRVGMVVGTIAYMSPEQARGKDVDHRSDIFSLGVTLYEMTTGQLPFSGSSPLDTMHAIAFEETAPITSLRRNLPPELQRIISRCLRKRPDDRYQHSRELVSDLKSLRRDLDSGVTRAVPVVDRIREQLAGLKKPGTGLILAAAGALALASAVLLFTGKIDLSPVVLLIGAGFWVYHRYRTRGPKLMKRFAAGIAKFPEVRLVAFQQNQATIVVDRLQARLYVRANSLMERINAKYFHGGPYRFAVRDDVSPDEFNNIVRQPGVLYIREDAFERSAPT